MNAVTVSTYEDLLASLADHVLIDLVGYIEVPQTINIPYQRVKIRGHSVLYGTPNIFNITGADCRISDVLIRTDGYGIVASGNKLRLSDVTINTKLDGIFAHNGAGLWMNRVHMNGLAPGRSGVRFGQWDTAWMTDCICEDHGTGVRFGWFGHTANVIITSSIFDGNGVTAIHGQCGGSGSIANVKVTNCWGAGGQYPMIFSAADGPVSTIELRHNRFSNVQNLHVPHSGVTNYFEEGTVYA